MADRGTRSMLLAANWKMHKTIEETERFLADFLPRVPESGSEVVICPPFLSLKAAVERCAESRARVAAQNMHEEQEGAFTGEVSAPMLVELGVDGVILGHSERRQYDHETDAGVAAKVASAVAHHLVPIACICSVWKEPSRPVMPWTMTRVEASRRMLT